MSSIERYADIVGEDTIEHLFQISKHLRGINVLHVNSTRVGGGVAELLRKIVPFQKELGMNAEWEVIKGTDEFYKCTKSFHNALQGSKIDIPPHLIKEYETINESNAEDLRDKLSGADIVFIHDPQPAMLLKFVPDRKGKWIWRCHIDISKPHRPVWKYMKGIVSGYDASIFSLVDFAQPLPHEQYIIPPSIDPLSEKNIELEEDEIDRVCEAYGIDRRRPIITQVSRFDRFKDPIGVMEAFEMTKEFIPDLQLVLAGGSADDDPEGAAVLSEVREYAEGKNDIHVLALPPTVNRTINALQRASDVILQKSLKEGFGLTVTESLWKYKPVIGGNTGGIKLQVIDSYTGFLVNSPEGASLRLRYLFTNREQIRVIGNRAHNFVKDNFLITRHLREYLTLMLFLLKDKTERLVL